VKVALVEREPQPSNAGLEGTSTIENLRAELTSGGVDAAKLDEQTLKQMLERVSRKEECRVSIADINTGRALTAGQQLPLTGDSIERKSAEQ